METDTKVFIVPKRNLTHIINTSFPLISIVFIGKYVNGQGPSKQLGK